MGGEDKLDLSDDAKAEQAVCGIFEHADENGDGELDQSEFKSLMQALDPTLTNKQIKDMRKAADLNDDGRICIKEFVHWVFTGEAKCHKASKCIGHIKSVVHHAVHGDGHDQDTLSDNELDMYWNQAQKIDKSIKPDGYVGLTQMVAFLGKLTQAEEDNIKEEFVDMWAHGDFPFARGPQVDAAVKARDMAPDDDHELLDKDGFFKVMRQID